VIEPLLRADSNPPWRADNADLATGFDRVMILALKRPPEIPSMSVASLDETVRTLQDNGA